MDYTNDDFQKRLNKVMKDLIIKNLIAHVPESDSTKLLPFLQKFLQVKYRHTEKPFQNISALQVKPIAYELEK